MQSNRGLLEADILEGTPHPRFSSKLIGHEKAFQTFIKSQLGGRLHHAWILSGQKGIGKTILTKLQEFVDTGTLNVLEKAKSNPMFIFTEVYGIGPKKAEELVKKHNVTTIVELRERQDELLNDVQKKGLKYYEDILKRIPRKEIDTYEKELKKIFDTVKNKDSTFQIMGSYRRGAKDSGDIDICISDPKDDTGVFIKFIDALIEKNILIEVLSRGNTKSLGVSKLRRKPARRIDFMFTKHKELAFALLYFTGSKALTLSFRNPRYFPRRAAKPCLDRLLI